MSSLRHYVERTLSSYWQIKLLALLLAGISWMGLNTLVTTTVKCRVSLQIEGAAEAGLIVRLSEAEAEVTLFGPREEMQRLIRQKIVGSYSVHALSLAAEEPERIVSVPVRDFLVFPSGIRPVGSIRPNKIYLTLMRSVNRSLRIRPVLIGQLPALYQLEQVSVIPSRITLSGAQSVLEGMEQISTEPIVLDDFQTPGIFHLHVRLTEHDETFFYEGDPEVIVQIRLSEKKQP